MFYFEEKALILPYAVAALSGGFNAAWFWGYRCRSRRRRIGALALFLVNAAIAAEGAYFAVGAALRGHEASSLFALLPALWLAARLLLCAGALSITCLILRRICSRP